MHNCDECGTEYPDCAKYCFVCEEIYCSGHLVKMHVKSGGSCNDSYCSDCNKRAAAKLSELNKQFEEWVTRMEGKYGGVNVSPIFSTDDIFVAMKEREMLRERCSAVGAKLSFKQKQFERYDSTRDRYESHVG